MIAASENNSDGWGVMFPENGRIRTIHSMSGVEELIRVTDRLRGVPHSIHFRFRTRGEVGEAQCHPFEILNKKEHGMDLWMMHNGTFSGVPVEDTDSDSKIFAGMLRNKIMEMSKENPGVPFKTVLRTFKNIIGTHNKLMFMSSGMDAILVNGSRGTWMGGVWFSNTYSLSRPAWKKSPSIFSYTQNFYKKWPKKLPSSTTASTVSAPKKSASSVQLALPSGRPRPAVKNDPYNGYRRKILTRLSPNGKQVQVITYVKN
jgi:predicted glutamine amidotransferase